MPILSGFCNPTNPPDSHGRCRKEDCPCVCHEAAEFPATPVRVSALAALDFAIGAVQLLPTSEQDDDVLGTLHEIRDWHEANPEWEENR